MQYLYDYLHYNNNNCLIRWRSLISYPDFFDVLSSGSVGSYELAFRMLNRNRRERGRRWLWVYVVIEANKEGHIQTLSLIDL